MNRLNQTTLLKFNTRRLKYPDGFRFKIPPKYFGIIAGSALIPFLLLFITFLFKHNFSVPRRTFSVLALLIILLAFILVDIYVYFDSLKWKPSRIYKNTSGSAFIQLGGEAIVYVLNESCQAKVSYGPCHPRWYDPKLLDLSTEWINKIIVLTVSGAEWHFHEHVPKPTQLPDSYNEKNKTSQYSFEIDQIDNFENTLKSIIPTP